MLSSCPRTPQWLHNSLKCWLVTANRSVSTTSAINRGLRATKVANSAERRGFDRRQSESETAPAIKEPKTSQKDRLNRLLRRTIEKQPGEKGRQIIEKGRPPPNYLSLREQTSARPRFSSQREQWGSREKVEGGNVPRLWFNRQDKRVELVLREGDSDQIVEQSTKKEEGSDESSNQASSTAFRGRHSPGKHQHPPISMLGSGSRERRTAKDPLRSVKIVNDDTEVVPVPIPYTTAASVFLYGSNAVYAALKANQRKFYKIHIHPRLHKRDDGYQSIQRLAKLSKVPVQSHEDVRLFDKLSDGRPHNGVVLEASRLPALPVFSLGKLDSQTHNISVQVESQSAEDEAINGNPKFISASRDTRRQPLIVMLDGITDPGNIGSILRTCHFYGVEAVAVATNTCANLNSPILAKASSGACEAVTILALSKPSAFVYESRKAGWRVFAAVAPQLPIQAKGQASLKSTSKYITTQSLASSSPLLKEPCILMLGAEDEGLRENLKNKADVFVSIEGAGGSGNVPDVGVDSLNVSVSASVLLESFLRAPLGDEKQGTPGKMGF